MLGVRRGLEEILSIYFIYIVDLGALVHVVVDFIILVYVVVDFIGTPCNHSPLYG